MSSSATEALDHPRAVAARVEGEILRVTVHDGREILVPVAWFDWLNHASDTERRDLRIIGGGAGVWWESLDDGISVPRLFGLPEDL